MGFFDGILTPEQDTQIEGWLNAYNEQHKDSPVRLANLTSGQYVDKRKYDTAITERDGYKTQLDTAAEQLKAFSGVDAAGIEKMKTDIKDWETKYNADTQALKAQLEQQTHESLAREYLSGVKFSSNLAKQAAMSGMLQETTVKDGKLSGADLYMERLKKENPDALVAEGDEGNSRNNRWTPRTGMSGNDGRKNNPFGHSAEAEYMKNKYGKNRYYKG
ncbi:MAG: phage scaffolding protein [Lachnospiraceae bacterium]|nr:phage scaffolding protein [Lachnospiraceae bacterium]